MSWSEVRRVFEGALELDPEEHAAYLAGACPDDGVRREVEVLLAQHRRAGAFLEPLDLRRLPETLARALGRDLAGQRLGAFHLRRVLAAGGMGTVYEAEQEEPRRTVALKVLRSGLPSESEVRRFRFESEVLGRLRHPGIAQVFQAGTHVLDEGEEGRALPWFAMEYVEGARSILEHAEEEGLGLEERLRLFREVCDAVHHAHLRGVIHRDLKPSNILVDSTGRPKVIDFGVARAIAPDEEGATLHTEVNHVLGTLRYMSPEQINADPGELDTRSDVYTLGVVLYELISGAPPYRLEGHSLVQAAKLVQDEPVRRPSSHDPAIPAELDWIVLRALAKDPERRYGSAAELGADLARFLAHQPVLAGPPSALYRLGKFVRRHRALVAGATVVLLALVLGVVGLGVGLVRARDEAAKAVAVREFFERILLSPSPAEEGRDVPMSTVLRSAAAGLDGAFADEPETLASLHLVIGKAFLELGEFDAAEPHLEACLEIRRRTLGEADLETLRARDELGSLRWQQGRFAEAEEIISSAVETMTARGMEDEDPELFLGMMNTLAIARGDLGRMDEAGELLARARGEAERLLGFSNEVTLSIWNNSARALEFQGELEEAEAILRRVVDERRELFGPIDPRTLIALDNLGWNLHKQGECAEGEATMRAALAGFRETNGPRHPDTGRCLHLIARCLLRQKRFVEAEELLRESVSIQDENPGPRSSGAVNARHHLALALEGQGRVAAAREVARRALDDCTELAPGSELPEMLTGILERLGE